MVFLWIVSGFGSTFEWFVDHCFFFFGKREYVKTSTACARELDFKVGRGLVLYSFEIFGGLVSGWLREWILSYFGMDLGSLWHRKSIKMGSISGVIFEFYSIASRIPPGLV